MDIDDKNELLSELSQASVVLGMLIEELTFQPRNINWGSDRIYNVEAHLKTAQGVWDRISYKEIAEDG